MRQIERLRKKLALVEKQEKHGIPNKYSATGQSGGSRRAISFNIDSAFELLDEIEELEDEVTRLKVENNDLEWYKLGYHAREYD